MVEEKEVLKKIEITEFIKKKAKEKYNNMRKRHEKFSSSAFNIKLEEIENLLLDNYNNGFSCCYCDKKLKFNEKYPFKASPSIDHKIPMAINGENKIDNLCVCCHECNIIKGTMSSEVFIKLLKLIMKYDPQLKDEIFNSIFKGKIANKIEREEKLK